MRGAVPGGWPRSTAAFVLLIAITHTTSAFNVRSTRGHSDHRSMSMLAGSAMNDDRCGPRLGASNDEDSAVAKSVTNLGLMF